MSAFNTSSAPRAPSSQYETPSHVLPSDEDPEKPRSQNRNSTPDSSSRLHTKMPVSVYVQLSAPAPANTPPSTSPRGSTSGSSDAASTPTEPAIRPATS